MNLHTYRIAHMADVEDLKFSEADELSSNA